MDSLIAYVKQNNEKEFEKIENEDDKKIIEIIERLEKEHCLNEEKKKKIDTQAIFKSGFDANTELCDKISNAMNNELEKNKVNQK